jgi:hypothetical protein
MHKEQLDNIRIKDVRIKGEEMINAFALAKSSATAYAEQLLNSNIFWQSSSSSTKQLSITLIFLFIYLQYKEVSFAL